MKVVILPVRPVWYCRQQSGGLKQTKAMRLVLGCVNLVLAHAT